MKNILRQQLKNIRASITDKDVKNKSISDRLMQLLDSLALDNKLKNKSVFIYQSLASEVDTSDIIKQLQKRGFKIFVPKVDSNFFMTATDLLNGQAANIVPAITIVPLLGFNKKLHRIGFGKGCYDKYLSSALQQTVSIGLAFDEQVCNFVAEPFDIPLDYIITPMLQLKA